MANIDRDLREIGRAIRTNIRRISQIPLRAYTLHNREREASHSAMEYVESLDGSEKEAAQKAYTEVFRKTRTYRVGNLVADSLDMARNVAGFRARSERS